MKEYYPRGNRLSALEKNELKRRALEMVLVLFYVEDLKQFIVESIRATDLLRRYAGGDRLPDGTKRLHKKAFEILVDAGVLTKCESDELQELIDYRNLIAHQMHDLTSDVGRYLSIRLPDDVRYQNGTLKRVLYFHKKLSSQMRQKFVLSVSFRGPQFEAAERAYSEELAILERKIRRQAIAARTEVEQANAMISVLKQSGLLIKLEPGHPNQINRSGQLTDKGINCCRELFITGASPFVVAHLMRISLRSATRQHRLWLANVDMTRGKA